MLQIRHEQPGDIEAIRLVNREAFGQDQEGRLVVDLRARGAVQLSLVAVDDGVVVGHILFSVATAGVVEGSGLGPMAVLPVWQQRGVGSQLVLYRLERLRERGCPFVVVVGHPDFYPRFGFHPAAALGLTCDWDVRAGVFMIRIVSPGAGEPPSGRVAYQPEFSTFA
jgi:putative acetyltransferase